VHGLRRGVHERCHHEVGAEGVAGLSRVLQRDQPQVLRVGVAARLEAHPGGGLGQRGGGHQQVGPDLFGALGFLQVEHVAELSRRRRAHQAAAALEVGRPVHRGGLLDSGHVRRTDPLWRGFAVRIGK
jgi:hypothetical protein